MNRHLKVTKLPKWFDFQIWKPPLSNNMWKCVFKKNKKQNNYLSLIWFILIRKGSSECNVKVDSSGVYTYWIKSFIWTAVGLLFSFFSVQIHKLIKHNWAGCFQTLMTLETDVIHLQLIALFSQMLFLSLHLSPSLLPNLAGRFAALFCLLFWSLISW